MFDLGFGELLLIALVALVVLGPERLPKAARFAGLWVRRARAQWYSVKSELERELAAEELKRNLDAARTAATDFEREVRTAASDLDRTVREKDEAARSGLKALRDELAGARETHAGPGISEAGHAAVDGAAPTDRAPEDGDGGR
jgi:sec-independent protein translocase protein TatB